MGGGIIQLVANENSVQDLYLTGDPQITYFKVLYRRPTSFSMADTSISIPTKLNFGQEVKVPIGPHADMLHVLSLIIDVPTPDVEFKDPTYRTIRDLLVPCNLDNVINQIALTNNETMDDLVTYEKLFGSDITNPTGPLAVAIDQLLVDTNVKYGKRLDILSKFKSEYKIADDRFGGRFIAIKPELIDFAQFEGNAFDPFGSSTKPIDPAGYLIMKADRTQDMYDQYVAFPTVDFGFDCMDFMYDPRTKTQYMNNESVYDPTLSPPAITVMKYLCKPYPRQIPNYRPIRTIADYVAALSDPSNHNIIIPISLINICRRVLLELSRIQYKSDPENLTDLDTMNKIQVDECLFGTISIDDLLGYEYEFGVYSYDPAFDDTAVVITPRVLVDYDTRLANVIRRSKIRIPMVSVDRDVKGTVTPVFNRYDSNENAIYNKTYDLTTPLRVPLTLVDEAGQPYLIDTEGYWLLDVSLIDTLEQVNPALIDDPNIQDVLTAVPNINPNPNNVELLINPYYLDARSDRLDYAPYVIEREWSNKLYKYETVYSTNGQIVEPDDIDPSDPTQVRALFKTSNIIDGLDTVSDMMLEAYSVPDAVLSSDVASMLNNDMFDFQDIVAYHTFLEAIRCDLIDTEDQISDYRLNSASGDDGSNIYDGFDPSASLKQTLFNARDIQKIMTGKLLRNIIYVDQQRFGKNFATTFNLYFKSYVLINFALFGCTSYIENSSYTFGSAPYTADRELAHRLTKFLMWAYDLEYIDVQSRASSTISQNITTTRTITTRPCSFFTSYARYFNLFYPSNSEIRYYVWFDTNGDGTTNDPGPPVFGAISVPVNISTLADPNNTADVALAIKTAIDSNPNTAGNFTTSLTGATPSTTTNITITSIASGNTTDITDFNTAYAFATPVQGDDVTAEVSTVNTATVAVLPPNYYLTTVRRFDLYYFNPKRYYVWFDTFGDGTTLDPGPPAFGAISLPVDISSIELPDDRAIALALSNAINTFPYSTDFTSTLDICKNLVTISTDIVGGTTDLFDGDTFFTFGVVQQGNSTTAEISTVDTTTVSQLIESNVLDTLSKMLIEMAIEPCPLIIPGPPCPPCTETVLDYLKHMRYSSDDIDEITDPYVYEDDSIIERFRTDIVVKPEDSYFERDQILSGIRFNSSSTINSEIENLRDLIGSGIKNPAFVDGRGTAINREVEFYHVLRTIDNTSSSNLSKLIGSTVEQYFIQVIQEAYEDALADPLNYINTVSYNVTLKYLRTYFARSTASTAELTLDQIRDVLLDVVQNTVLRVLNNYNEYLFYVWKNSTYIDQELQPRIYTDTIFATSPFDFRMRDDVDFCSPSIRRFLDSCYADRSAEYDLNPDLLKAKFWAGIDQKFRPRMGYLFGYDLVFTDPASYRTEVATVLEEREFTADTAGQTSIISTPSVLGASEFKDHYSTYIDNEINKIKSEMQNVISYGPANQTNLETGGINTMRERLAYVDWFDLQNFQTRAVNRIALERSLLCPTDLAYYEQTYVINHLPSTLSYYYYLYTQQMYASIYTAIEANDLNSIEALPYTNVPSFVAAIDDVTITPITTATITASGVSTTSTLQFMSTDPGENPECPIHSYVLTNLSDAQKTLFDDYLTNNAAITNDLVPPIFNECPLCFRTYELYKLSHEMLSTVFSSDSTIEQSILENPSSFQNDITDGSYINTVQAGAQNVSTDTGTHQTMFVFRPEVVYYDRVTETFYDTAIQYFLVRYSTIYYRYARMVLNTVGLSLADYATYTANISPLIYPATPPGAVPVFGQLNTTTYADYVTHITALRVGALGPAFENEIDLFCKAIMQNPSPALVVALKSSIRLIPSTVEYIDYGRGETTIFAFDPDLVIQNIEYNPLLLIPESFDSIRYMMYRGNISLWYAIQRRIIDYYNAYLNELIDPRQIETTNDLFIETYNIFLEIVPPQYIISYVSGRPVIDFYRFKQTYEAGQVTTLETPILINDLQGAAINMIEYARELMIYYKMLVVRYEKMRFVLQNVKLATIDDNSLYFEKSDIIAKKLLDPIKTRIESMKKAELVLQNVADREYFYFQDTSNLYYIDPVQFRLDISNVDDPAFVDDYINFNYLNSYQLSEVFSFNQSRNLIRMLGLINLNEQSSTFPTFPSISVDPLYVDLNLLYTDDFKRYRTLAGFTTDLDNTSKYMYQSIDQSMAGYQHILTPNVIANRGLFYDIWANYPTVSNILYDLDFDPVTFDEPIRVPGIMRYYTGIDSSSPLNILKNRLEQFDFASDLCGTFHTPCLKQWESTYICNQPDIFDAIRRVFNVYYFMTGAYDYQDIYTMLGFARLDIAEGSKSITNTISQLKRITTDVVQSMTASFGITNTPIRISNQLTIVMVLKNRHGPTVNQILSTYTSNTACIRARIDLIATQLSFGSCLTPAEITTLLNGIYSSLNLMDATMASITIDSILAGVETGIINQTIITVADLQAVLDSNLASIEAVAASTINAVSSNLLTIQEDSCMKFAFIRADNPVVAANSSCDLIQDIRVHTPVRLFGLNELQLMRNFKYVEDVVRFLIAGVVGLVTPTTDRITSIYLDGVVTEAESLVLNADLLKQTNPIYKAPSIFDGAFNRILIPVLGESDPFKAGNYFRTSLPEALRTILPQYPDIYSTTTSYNNMLIDTTRTIQTNFNTMDKLSVLTRYVDTTKQPVAGYYYYDFSIYVPFDPTSASRSVSRTARVSDVSYAKHKSDVRQNIEKRIRITKSALIDKSKPSIYANAAAIDSVTDANVRTKSRKLKITDTNRSVRQCVCIDPNPNVPNTPLFYGSDVYNKIVKILNRSHAIPQHAWVRQLGFRAVEEISLIIDGEEIDGYTSELMLMLRKAMVEAEHDRGMDIMIGHIPEMYEISDMPRPSVRLYVNTFFSFSRFIACSLPLLNMLYSEAFIRIKLRRLEDLLYIEPGARLASPIKIVTKLLGRYIYLEDDERKRIATTRTVGLIERFRTVSVIKTLSDITSSKIADRGDSIPGGKSVQFQTNVTKTEVDRLLKQRYYFSDPTKYLLWRMRLIYPNPAPEDIIYWDVAAGSDRENLSLGLVDEFNKPITRFTISDRTKLMMNSKTRDNWRHETYYRRLTTNKTNVRVLDLNEGLYSFALYLSSMGVQPSGATNLSMVDNFTVLFDLNTHIVAALRAGARIQIDMFQCSHNLFIAMSGFGALGFYGTK